jgi:hypothetical protein
MPDGGDGGAYVNFSVGNSTDRFIHATAWQVYQGMQFNTAGCCVARINKAGKCPGIQKIRFRDKQSR